jgi:hypothetical protein
MAGPKKTPVLTHTQKGICFAIATRHGIDAFVAMKFTKEIYEAFFPDDKIPKYRPDGNPDPERSLRGIAIANKYGVKEKSALYLSNQMHCVFCPSDVPVAEIPEDERARVFDITALGTNGRLDVLFGLAGLQKEAYLYSSLVRHAIHVYENVLLQYKAGNKFLLKKPNGDVIDHGPFDDVTKNHG